MINPEAIAKSVNNLYSLPAVVMRINELLANPNSSSLDFERIIINDPGLTLKVLKFVNSAYFGYPQKIDTLSQAITLIGLEELRNLVLATSITAVFRGIPEEYIDMQSFWFHSITCGVLSRTLAKKCKIPKLETFFIMGLLHCIGKLVLISQFPEQYLPIVKAVENDEITVLETEYNIFGFSHPLLTAELLKYWQIPVRIWQVILYQYKPLDALEYQQDACILHVAAIIASAIEPYAKVDPNIQMVQQILNDSPILLLNLDEQEIQDLVFDTTLQTMSILDIIVPGSNLIY